MTEISLARRAKDRILNQANTFEARQLINRQGGRIILPGKEAKRASREIWRDTIGGLVLMYNGPDRSIALRSGTVISERQPDAMPPE